MSDSSAQKAGASLDSSEFSRKASKDYMAFFGILANAATHKIE